MTREEAIKVFNTVLVFGKCDCPKEEIEECFNMAIKALEQEPCEDAISRQAVIRWVKTECNPYGKPTIDFEEGKKLLKYIDNLPSVTPQPKTGHCKDCKWWKDSDGAYRRGIDAESKCPMNRIEVYEGNGYCFMFEPQESEVNNGYRIGN